MVRARGAPWTVMAARLTTALALLHLAAAATASPEVPHVGYHHHKITLAPAPSPVAPAPSQPHVRGHHGPHAGHQHRKAAVYPTPTSAPAPTPVSQSAPKRVAPVAAPANPPHFPSTGLAPMSAPDIGGATGKVKDKVPPKLDSDINNVIDMFDRALQPVTASNIGDTINNVKDRHSPMSAPELGNIINAVKNKLPPMSSPNVGDVMGALGIKGTGASSPSGNADADLATKADASAAFVVRATAGTASLIAAVYFILLN